MIIDCSVNHTKKPILCEQRLAFLCSKAVMVIDREENKMILGFKVAYNEPKAVDNKKKRLE